MSNPDPSLTPEEAATQWLGSDDWRQTAWTLTNEGGSWTGCARYGFLAGRAHATAQANHREFCANSAPPGDVANVVLERDALRAQVARLTQERNEAVAYCGAQRQHSDFKTADDMRDALESERALRLQSEQQCATIVHSVTRENLEALAVVEKMREALANFYRWREEPENGMKSELLGRAIISMRAVLSLSPSLALLEFAEKVWKEAFTTGFEKYGNDVKGNWLASDTYRDLTRATGDQAP